MIDDILTQKMRLLLKRVDHRFHPFGIDLVEQLDLTGQDRKFLLQILHFLVVDIQHDAAGELLKILLIKRFHRILLSAISA